MDWSRWRLRRGTTSVPETKDSRTGPLIALTGGGRPRWTPRDYAELAREGFGKNPVAYRAIRMIAEAAASVPLVVFDGEVKCRDHGLAQLLDRPNPAGRPVEGQTLKPGWESFVGAGPMPMRHGLTMGELGLWFIDQFKLDVDYHVVEMQGWAPEAGPGFGWPLGERAWVNPSPNAPNLSMARCYAGTVMLEGATLSEGRGTTRPLELFGAPDIDARAVIAEMRALAPEWLGGCTLRDMWFEPTFHKHVGKLCSGVQIHVDHPGYDHAAFRPWRVQALGFKAIRRLYPDYDLWRDFPYEYAFGKLPIDVINGGPGLREWVDDAAAGPGELDAAARPDEAGWEEVRRPFLLY